MKITPAESFKMAYSKVIFIRITDNPENGMSENLPSSPHQKHFHITYDSILSMLNEEHQNREIVNITEYFYSDDPKLSARTS